MIDTMVQYNKTAHTGAGQRIMLVEDELLLRMMMTDILERLNYVVIPARSGEEALELIENGKKFDLLLTDIVMSSALDGFELARIVRDRFKRMPVIYSSGFTNYTKRQMGKVKAPILEKLATPAEIAQMVFESLEGAREKVA